MALALGQSRILAVLSALAAARAAHQGVRELQSWGCLAGQHPSGPPLATLAGNTCICNTQAFLVRLQTHELLR